MSYKSQHNYTDIKEISSGTTNLSNIYSTVLANAGSGAVTINLPAAATYAEIMFIIKAIDVTNSITITPNGVETIDGVAGSITLSTLNEIVTLQSDGSQWIKLDNSFINEATTAAEGITLNGTTIELGTTTQNDVNQAFSEDRYINLDAFALELESTNGDAYPTARFESGGNVGIGTATPTEKLDIAGGSIKIDNSHYYRSETNTGQSVRMMGMNSGNAAYIGPIDAGPTASIYNASPTSVASIFYTSGTEKMRITSNGNVGIGTANPTTKLQIVDENPYVSISGTNQVPRGAGIIFQTGGGNWYTYTGNDNHYHIGRAGDLSTDYLSIDRITGLIRFNKYGINTHTGTPTYNLAVDVNGNIIEVGLDENNIYGKNGTLTGNRTVTMGGNDLIFSGGNVGIGTANPSSKLELKGTDDNILTLSDATAGTAATPNEIAILFTGYNGASKARIYSTDETSNFNRGQLVFETQENAGALSEKMRITHEGNVGIGTTTPAQKLDVSGGTVRFSDYGSGTQTGTVTQILGVDVEGDIIEVGLDENNIYGKDGTLTGDRTVTMGGNDLIFSGGNVGIGITAPTENLHVDEKIKIESNSAVSTNILLENTGTGDALTTYVIPQAASWSTGVDRSDNLKFKISQSPIFLDSFTWFTIDRGTGNVGIGTSSPTQKLDVSGGTVRFSDYGSGTQTGTVTQILGVDGDGDIIEVGLDENNLYGKDGTLTGNRTVAGGEFSLTMTDTNYISLQSETAVGDAKSTIAASSDAVDGIRLTNQSLASPTLRSEIYVSFNNDSFMRTLDATGLIDNRVQVNTTDVRLTSTDSTDTAEVIANTIYTEQTAQIRQTGTLLVGVIAQLNNFANTNLKKISHIDFTLTGNQDITGIDATDAVDGTIITFNVATADLTFKHADATSSVGNRFTLPNSTDVTVRAGGGGTLRYNGTLNDWMLVGVAG